MFLQSEMPGAYVLKPLKIGCEVVGINLCDVSVLNSENVVQQIKKDVTDHRILVFRNQSKRHKAY
jgi:hypothetical protein